MTFLDLRAMFRFYLSSKTSDTKSAISILNLEYFSYLKDEVDLN